MARIVAIALVLAFASCGDIDEGVSGGTRGASSVQEQCFVLCAPGYRPAPSGACACIPEPGHSCEIMGKCMEGYKWSDAKCGCVPDPVYQRCGNRWCGAGQVCCNESCGVCTKPLEGCTQELCLPKGERCGKTFCFGTEYCCNDSCGICAPPGYACVQIACAKK